MELKWRHLLRSPVSPIFSSLLRSLRIMSQTCLYKLQILYYLNASLHNLQSSQRLQYELKYLSWVAPRSTWAVPYHIHFIGFSKNWERISKSIDSVSSLSGRYNCDIKEVSFVIFLRQHLSHSYFQKHPSRSWNITEIPLNLLSYERPTSQQYKFSSGYSRFSVFLFFSVFFSLLLTDFLLGCWLRTNANNRASAARHRKSISCSFPLIPT